VAVGVGGAGALLSAGGYRYAAASGAGQGGEDILSTHIFGQQQFGGIDGLVAVSVRRAIHALAAGQTAGMMPNIFGRAG